MYSNLESLSKIKNPNNPFYCFKDSSFFQYLASNEFINFDFQNTKECRFSKETVFQKIFGFFQYICEKNQVYDNEFATYIYEVHFKQKATLQKQKNYITLLLKSLEEWSLESPEIEFIRNLLIKENKNPKYFSFYIKVRRTILNHYKLVSQKNCLFLDEVDLNFSKKK